MTVSTEPADKMPYSEFKPPSIFFFVDSYIVSANDQYTGADIETVDLKAY